VNIKYLFLKVCSSNVQLQVDETGKQTGVAMVKFPSNDSAVKAMENNERYFLGRPLKLFLQNNSTI